MHILIIGINYTPEKIGIGENTTKICEYLLSQRHRVSMVTSFPHYPEWKIHRAYQGRIFMHEDINGVSVYRGYTCVPRLPLNAFQRIIYHVVFAISAFILGLTIGKVDVILAISPPLEGGVTAYILAKIKRAKFVIQLQDLVPDLAISLGILKNPLAIKVGKIMELFVYQKAKNILVICKGFIDNLKSKGVVTSKIKLLPNWVDVESIRPLEHDNFFRQNNDIDGKFLVLHSGNMGAKQKLVIVIEAAKYLSDFKDVLFILAGEGPRKEFLKKTAEGLSNVRFMPLQPKEAFPYMLSAADVLILNQSANVVDMVLPYKLLNYMSAGRPIVASVNLDSETARYIRWADCGLIVPPEKPQELADAIRKIYDNRELGIRFGKNGRTFAEANFSREKVLKDYLDFFENLINTR